MGGVLVGGCSAAAIETASIPSGQAISDFYTADFFPSVNVGDSPQDTLVIGTSYVDQRCSEFFDAVEQTNRKIEVGKSGFLTASTQIQTLLSLAKRSTLAIAYVASAVEVTKVLLDEYQEQFAFAPHSVELRSIVFDALAKERKDLETISASKDFTRVDAVASVKRYAENCTLGRIREHWNGALAKAVREGVTAQAAPAGGATAGRRGHESAGGDSRSGPKPRSVLSVNRYVVR